MGGRDGERGPADHAALIQDNYTDAFLDGLERQFGLDANADMRAELRTIGRLYLTFRHMGDGGDQRREYRRQYSALAKQTGIFLEILGDMPREDMNFGLHMAALRLGEPIPTTKFEGLSAHAQSNSGAPYFLELIRLLKMLKNAAEQFAGDFRQRPGPKINFGLELMVRRVAELFLTDFKRPFSVDHHKPVAASEAFDFIRALVAPLDEISDTAIITAIRTEQNARRNLSPNRNKPKS